MKASVTFIYFIFTVLSYAGSGGPDAHGYQWFDQDDEGSAQENQIINHTSAATVVLANDATDSALQVLDVPWGGIYGQHCTSLRVSRDGFLSFSTANDPTPDCPLPAVPTGSPVNGHARIYVHHQDLAGGTVLYERFDESPHDGFRCGASVFTWLGVQQASGDQTPFTVQVLLFDDFDILIQYGKMPRTNPFTVGIQNATASIGLGVHCGGGSSPPKSNAAILIEPPVLMVDTAADELDTPSGPSLSLREAVRDAVSGSRIEFDGSLFFNYTTLELSGSTDIGIDGKTIAMGRCTAETYSFDGGKARRHFTIERDGYLALLGFRLFDGLGAAGSPGSVQVSAGTTFVASACRWEGNHAGSGGYGGAINAAESAQVYLRGCNFYNNQSGRVGGAIVAEGAVVDASRCRFWKNSSSLTGGALATYDSRTNVRSTFKMNECDLALNEAGGEGGAVHLGNANANFFSCTFDDNRTWRSGGAVMATGGPAGSPSAIAFTRCTFYGNRAETGGGALSYTGGEPGATFAIDGSTIYRNNGGISSGALLIGDGDVAMNNTVVADNLAGRAKAQFWFSAGGTGSLVALANNVETGNEGGFAISNVSDIGLSSLGYFGGFVRTCVPLTGSPVIGAGSQSSADARGFPITFPSEAGAVELAPIHLVTSNSPTGPDSIQAALDAVGSAGGVIRFDGIDRIDVADLNLPEAPVMIEGPVILHGCALSANVKSPLAFYSCRLRGVGRGRLLRAEGAITFDRCEISDYTIATSLPVIETKLLSISESKLFSNPGGHKIDVSGTDGLFFRDSQISENCAFETTLGEGIQAVDSFVVIQRSSISENQFWNPDNGRIQILEIGGGFGSGSTLHLENTTISDNSVNERLTPYRLDGVRFYQLGDNSRVVGDIRHCTIAGNTAVGGTVTGIFASHSQFDFPDVTVTNSIVANHDVNFQIDGDAFSRGGNLSDGDIPGALASDIENTDPLLSALVLGQNHTLHRYPRIGSAAINAGLETVFAGSLDGRGQQRWINANNGVAGSLPDIGAVETGARIFVTTAVDEDDGGLGQGTGNSLREVLTLADNIGGANIGFAAALHGSVIPAGFYAIEKGIVDIDALGTGIVLEGSGDGLMFRNIERGALSIHGLEIDLNGEGGLLNFGDAVTTFQQCELYGGDYAVTMDDRSGVRVSESWIRDNDGANVFLLRGDNSLSLVHSTLSGNSAIFSCVQAEGTSRFAARGSTFARNSMIDCFRPEDEGVVRLDGCTVSRNKGIGTTSEGHTFLRDNVFHNNLNGFVFGTKIDSYGGNRSSILESRLDHPDDAAGVPIFLSPLADYDGNGVKEMPAQSVSRGLFVGNPYLKATNSSDSNNFTFISLPDKSLRQAIHFAEDGDVITFDPSVNGATISLVFSDLVIDRSITIDASTLPDGITIDGVRSIELTGDVTVCFINVQFQDRNNSATSGGGIHALDGANLVLDRCTFTNCSASFGGAISASGGSIFAQNCTFYDNSATSRGGAIFLQNLARATFEHCTFDQNDAGFDGGAISGNGSSHVEVFACAFGSNMVTSTGKLGNIEMVSTGTAASLGYNIFSDEPVFAVSTDGVGGSPELNPLAENGGGVATQTPESSNSNAVDLLPRFSNIPPPWVDARGYPRRVGVGPDAGSTEHGAESVDTDGDMMPDWWEIFYGLAYLDSGNADDNHDGDGGDDLAEFQNGTNPLVVDLTLDGSIEVVSFSTIQAENGNPAGVELNWIGEVGTDYQFQYSTDLVTWTDVNTPVTGSGEVQTSATAGHNMIARFFVRMKKIP